jgi:hypothetical protein
VSARADLPAEWTLRWVTGPRGEQRGPSLTGTAGELELRIP